MIMVAPNAVEAILGGWHFYYLRGKTHGASLGTIAETRGVRWWSAAGLSEI
jgi:hypothetical protein